MSFYKRYRTLMLAIIAALTFAYAAVFIFDVDPAEIGNYFLLSLLGVLILATAAFLLVFTWKMIGRYFKR